MKVFNNVDFDEWQEIANKCDYSTFFHTPAWSEIFTKTYPNMRIATLKFVLDDQTRAILPQISIRSKIGINNSYYSNIAGVYGGVISERKINKNEIDEIFTFLINRNIMSISIVGNPLFNYTLPEQFKIIVDFTQIIKLSKGKDKLWADYKYSTRKQINKAKRFGLEFKIANDNIDEWKKYYSIYLEALKRWGGKATSHYPFSLFENMFKSKNPNIKLWFVIFNGTIVGGNLNFYHNKYCVEWHGSFLSDYFKYGIRNFLVHNIILDAIEKGYRYYDFNPSGGHEGTEKFKETFCPDKLLINRWEWENPFYKKMAEVKRNVMNKLRIS